MHDLIGRKLTPFLLITQSIGPPPTPQPKQCHRFFAGVTTSDAVSSSWTGQRPSRSLPPRLSAMPAASMRRSTLTSCLSRSISCSGMRAMAGGHFFPTAAQGLGNRQVREPIGLQGTPYWRSVNSMLQALAKALSVDIDALLGDTSAKARAKRGPVPTRGTWSASARCPRRSRSS
jgi:hypothetical protein